MWEFWAEIVNVPGPLIRPDKVMLPLPENVPPAGPMVMLREMVILAPKPKVPPSSKIEFPGAPNTLSVSPWP